jgi:hypothetical protein
MKISKKQRKAVKAIVKQYTSREFPEFEVWLTEQWNTNPPAILADNPPNHISDVEDGTIDLSVGRPSVTQKREHHKHLKGGIFAYRIRCDDDFRAVVRFIPKMSEDAQQEAAMAFLLEFRKGSYLCNTQEWREVAAVVGNKDNLDNPFYKAVCQAILEVFRKEGWI